MAGSGRGRGRASFTFSIESIGFGKGAALSDVICKPPPPFPQLRDTVESYQDDEKEQETWTPDWRRLPRQMRPKNANKKGAKPKKAKSSEPNSNLDVILKIETALRQELEKKDEEEEKSEDEKDKTKDKEGEDDEETEEYDEEEHEEESDYISSCFEDGDDFGAVSDDNMDEATY